jgi:hypothetical protein
VDYSRKRIFEDLDTAIEFYLMQLVAVRDCWFLTIGCLPAGNDFVVHHSCWSFPLP